MDCPFDPTPPNPLRFGLDLDPEGKPWGFGSVRSIAEKAARNVEYRPGLVMEHRRPRKAVIPAGMATLRDYCNRHKIHVAAEDRKQVAARLIEMTHRAGRNFGHVPDERFGKLNCYPVKILDKWRATLDAKR